VVKVIPHKVPSPPQTDDSIVFARWRQRALPSGNMTELVLFSATQIHNPNSKSIGSAVFAQLTAESPYNLQRAPLFPLKIAPSHGRSGPPSKTRFLEPIRAQNPYSILIGSAFFAQMTAECHICRVPILYNGLHLSPSKLPLPMGDVDPHLTRGSVGQPESSTERHLDRFSCFCRVD